MGSLWLSQVRVLTKVGSFVCLFVLFILMLMSFLENGKLITWGSSDDEGQSYVASGKHGVKKMITFLFFLCVCFLTSLLRI